jgi:cellulose synthase/poly-beta-1,6-N-acetylglucosamine synthase-like glycosyltransferase
VIPRPASDRTIALGQLAIALTVLGWIAFVYLTVSRTSLSGAGSSPALDFQAIGYLVVITLLCCSSVAYLAARLGYYHRTRTHRRATRGELGALQHTSPTLTVLVPSYREDERVNRMTLLSAALQEYPDLEVVLLIDDPPEPRYASHARMLASAMSLPAEIELLLSEPARRFQRALDEFDLDFSGHGVRGDKLVELSREYDFAARWLEQFADDYDVVDHADRFLVDQVILGLCADMTLTAAALREAAEEGAEFARGHARHLLQRLTWIFGARLSSFQRKRFVSLSHEPNKAMNLNSYIGLMGGRYREVEVPAGGRALVPTAGEADLVVREPDYVLTLDADSVLLPEYCLRLVHLLEQSEHERTAVAQSPYSAFPGAPTRIERIAGATTDIQHMLHQGMTHYDATFWVGANAILRKRALNDLCEVEHVGNYEIKRYISDRTVIEDTESSIDLGVHGWRLFNYPERLSYSATPPDFGALCVQRSRWANGGLLILPGLWRQMRTRRQRGEYQHFGESALRTNYMASICWSSFALVVLLAYQFDNELITPLVMLISVPYFLMMATDLRHCGYNALDVVRIYGFNLVLVPVNLAGVFSSLLQGLLGYKPAFKRTPKVRTRTVAGLSFVILPYLFVAFSVLMGIHYLHTEHWVNVVLAGANATLGLYGIVAFIGLRNSALDIWHNVARWLHKPQRSRVKSARARTVNTGSREIALPATTTVAPGHWSRTLGYAALDAGDSVELNDRSGQRDRLGIASAQRAERSARFVRSAPTGETGSDPDDEFQLQTTSSN